MGTEPRKGLFRRYIISIANHIDKSIGYPQQPNNMKLKDLFTPLILRGKIFTGPKTRGEPRQTARGGHSRTVSGFRAFG